MLCGRTPCEEDAVGKGLQLNRKENEKQHQFNKQVQDKIKNLTSTPPTIERVNETLKGG